jgi:hypothetical protein
MTEEAAEEEEGVEAEGVEVPLVAGVVVPEADMIERSGEDEKEEGKGWEGDEEIERMEGEGKEVKVKEGEKGGG